MIRYGRTDFPSSVKLAAWQRCGGYCEECRAKIFSAEYDHVVPTSLGGEPTLSNCACLCKRCHRLKTTKQDIPAISKVKRIEKRRANLQAKPSRSWPRHRSSNVRQIDEERDNG